jgi:hypothetical protein
VSIHRSLDDDPDLAGILRKLLLCESRVHPRVDIVPVKLDDPMCATESDPIK